MINSIVVVVGSRLKIEKQDKCPKGVGGGGGAWRFICWRSGFLSFVQEDSRGVSKKGK